MYFVGIAALKVGVEGYELSNHLGNVLAVVNDRKVKVDSSGNGQADWYEASILSASDYYPFGLEMRGRVMNSGDYRWGFNGKERDGDGEWGSNAHYDYGFRIYDPGIARFLSVDPLTGNYPFYTPYQFAGNKPIAAIDLEGAEPKTMIDKTGRLTRPVIEFLNAAYGYNRKSLSSTRWFDLDRVKDFGDKKTDGVKISADLQGVAHTAIAINGMTAITLDDIVIYDPKVSSNNDQYWFPLIAHEQSHVEDYDNQGNAGFVSRYLYQSATRNGYGSEFTEQKAYAFDRVLTAELATNPTILNTLNNSGLDEYDKLDLLRIEGLKVRKKVIQTEIAETRNELNNNDLSKKTERGLYRRILQLKQEAKGLGKRINDTQNELNQRRARRTKNPFDIERGYKPN